MKPQPKRFLTRAILATFYTAGEIGNITIKSFFAHPYCHYFCHHHKHTAISSAFYKLRQQKMIRKIGPDTFELTRTGRGKAMWASSMVEKYLPQKHEKWDGKWRLLIFDIPEKKRHKRDSFRELLNNYGFKELQRSVWVTPYKIPRIIDDIIWEEKLIGFTRVMTIIEIDYDQDLKKYFKLS